MKHRVGRGWTAVVAVGLVSLIWATLLIGCQANKTPLPAASPITPTIGTGGVPTGPHPTPVTANYYGCPPEGSNGDPELNVLKNRTDTASWQPTTVDAILGLKWPKGAEKKHMSQWSQSDRAQIAPYNGVPVQAEGYLLAAKAEGPESPNCGSKDEVDYHVWMAAQPNDDRGTKSVVVEITPRVRSQHSGWGISEIQKLVQQKTHLRISGWLFFDPEHPDEVGKTRGTIWEIHPIMQIEVAEPGGTWRKLP